MFVLYDMQARFSKDLKDMNIFSSRLFSSDLKESFMKWPIYHDHIIVFTCCMYWFQFEAACCCCSWCEWGWRQTPNWFEAAVAVTAVKSYENSHRWNDLRGLERFQNLRNCYVGTIFLPWNGSKSMSCSLERSNEAWNRSQK